jgi:hypothetical protein
LPGATNSFAPELSRRKGALGQRRNAAAVTNLNLGGMELHAREASFIRKDMPSARWQAAGQSGGSHASVRLRFLTRFVTLSRVGPNSIRPVSLGQPRRRL